MSGKAVFQGGNAQSLDNIAGQPIAEYTHSKSGTVHKLEGPVNAKNIVFKATGDYNDGDTWTLNNHPVTVTYNGGEELLPTAVLVGDTVQAVIMGGKLRLMLQKPTPQENALINWNYADPVNQRGKGDYTAGDPFIYALDMVRLRSAVLTLGQEYTNVNFTGNGAYVPRMAARAVCDLKAGQKYTIAGLLRVGSNAKGIRLGATAQETVITGSIISLSPAEQFKLVTKTFTAPNNIENPEVEILGSDKTSSGSADVIGLKLEPGKRFTGWPAWDYGAELRKCQRYFYKTVLSSNVFFQMNGIAYKSNELDSFLFLPVTMREGGKPVIQYSAGEKIAAWSPKNDSWGSTTHNITDIILEQFSGNQALLSIATTGLDIGENYFWQTKGGYISFSRDL